MRLSDARSVSDTPVVLVVDDELLIRMMVVDALGDEGMSCVEASGIDEALAALEREAGIALLITDVGLGEERDGRWLASRARASRKDLAVLLMTGYSDAGLADDGIAVLPKPFEISELIAMVRAQIPSHTG
jgi:DNA-binding response OmpR family regulator